VQKTLSSNLIPEKWAAKKGITKENSLGPSRDLTKTWVPMRLDERQMFTVQNPEKWGTGRYLSPKNLGTRRVTPFS